MREDVERRVDARRDSLSPLNIDLPSAIISRSA
jgi:hypothetical protein